MAPKYKNRWVNYASKLTKGRRSKFARDYPATNMALKLIKTGLNTEQKYHQTTGTAVPVTNIAGGPINRCLNEIARGVSDDERIGNQVKSVYLGIRGALEYNPSATSPTIVRALVIKYKRSAGTNPDISDLMQGTVPWSFRSLTQTRNYTLLASRTYNLSSQVPQRYVNINIKRQIILDFDGATAASFDGNAIFLLMWSDDGTNSPTFTFQTRLRYVDN